MPFSNAETPHRHTLRAVSNRYTFQKQEHANNVKNTVCTLCSKGIKRNTLLILGVMLL